MYVYYEIGLTEFCNWFHFAICINFLPCVKIRQLETHKRLRYKLSNLTTCRLSDLLINHKLMMLCKEVKTVFMHTSLNSRCAS